jgi:hypothetical protein
VSGTEESDEYDDRVEVQGLRDDERRHRALFERH